MVILLSLSSVCVLIVYSLIVQHSVLLPEFLNLSIFLKESKLLGKSKVNHFLSSFFFKAKAGSFLEIFIESKENSSVDFL